MTGAFNPEQFQVVANDGEGSKIKVEFKVDKMVVNVPKKYDLDEVSVNFGVDLGNLGWGISEKFAIRKADNELRIHEAFVPEALLDFSYFPNPTDNLINVEAELPYTDDVTVSIIDLNAQVVKELYQGRIKAGHPLQVQAALSDLPGKRVYILELHTRKESIRRKIILDQPMYLRRLIAFWCGVLSLIVDNTMAQVPFLRLDNRTSIGFSLSGGYNVSYLDGKALVAEHLSLRPLLVPAMAVRVKNDLSDQVSLLTGVELGSWGLNYGGDGFLYYGTVNVPLTIRYYFGPVTKKTRWFAGVGGVLRFAQLGNDSTRFSGASGRGESGSYSDVRWISRFRKDNPTVGGLASFGVERPLGKQWRVGLLVFFHQGFSNLVDNEISVWASNDLPPPGAYAPPAESYRLVRQESLDIKGTTFDLTAYFFFSPF